MEKIMITGPFNAAMRAALEQAFPAGFTLEYVTSREEYGKLADADYTIIRTLNYTAGDIASMPKLKLIQKWGAGYDTIDVEAAAGQGVPVAITWGMNATPVSEMALALTLAVYRNLVPLTTGIQAGRWEREQYAQTSYTIFDKTVGLVGLGNIGRKVAALFRAFGANVLYYDLYRLPPEEEQALGVTYSALDDLWGRCNILSLHAPLTEETRHLVNRDTLAKMGRGTVLINTAREELVDAGALAEALASGDLLGAGLDAIEEPIVRDNPFKGMPNVVLSGHLGGNTVDNAVHMARRCAEQIVAVSRGEALGPPHVVNAALLNNR